MGNAPRRRTKERRPKTGTQTGTGRPWLKWGLGGLVAALIVVGVIYISSDVTGNPQGVADPPPGTEIVQIGEASHTLEPIAYARVPPAGGSHHPEWLTCRVYSAPVRNENAVHALEHGAIWITYDPSLDANAIDDLEGFGRRREVIVSPYPELGSPVVVTAWGRQLRLESADTGLIDQFYRAFQDRTAPETAATC
jgi:hypothetical protein